MTITEQHQTVPAPVKPQYVWLAWGGALLVLLLIFRVSLQELFITWSNVEEYSHGFFIPVISFYLIWIRRAELVLSSRFRDSIPGLLVMLLGLAVFLLGGLSAIRTLEQYSFLITLTGLFAAAFGLRGMRTAGIPLLFLIFMVPLPPFIMNNLSSKLQLISSWLGVEFIRSCDIMVYLEGNVIDLGSYRLQVVDACSGLRYLFPLSSLAFLCAFLFKGPFWQKLLVFLSSMPLTIFMNSFRIGVIGVLVNRWGTEMAEGFLHDFEGWAVFLLCMVLLFMEMWVLSRISGKRLAMNELVEIPPEWEAFVRREPFTNGLNTSIYAVLLLLLLGGVVSESWSKNRMDILPQRNAFLNFPDQLGQWRGHKDILAKLKAGGNFEELAKKNSVDSSSAKGGDLGWFGKGSMVPAFEKAALALKEGQISDVVKSDFGYHIIKLTGKRPAGIRPFEEVKEQIKGAIMPTKQQEIFQKIKEELKKTAKITIKEDVLNSVGGKKEEPKADEKKPAEAPKAAAPEKK